MPVAARHLRSAGPARQQGLCDNEAGAEQEGAVLVHKDPEFRSLAHLHQDWLG